jgi:hypothetical protein
MDLGEGSLDVLMELGYEPPELCNHGGIHDLVGRLVWWTAAVWIWEAWVDCGGGAEGDVLGLVKELGWTVAGWIRMGGGLDLMTWVREGGGGL